MNRQTVILTTLIISVALNLLVAGLVAGRFIFGPDRPHHLGMGPERMMQFDPSALDPTTREVLRHAFRQNNEAAKTMRRSLHKAQKEVRELLVDGSFDPEAMEAALLNLRTQMHQYQALRHKQMVDTLEQLTPEDRLRVYQFLSPPGLEAPSLRRHHKQHGRQHERKSHEKGTHEKGAHENNHK